MLCVAAEANSERSVTPGDRIRSASVGRLSRRLMSWRSVLACCRRLTVAVAVLFSALPLATPTLADETIVDNSASAVQVKGTWTSSTTTGGFMGPDYLFRTAGGGSFSVTWPFPSAAPGRYEVFARWSAGPNRATNATYQITSSSGQTSVSVNQKSNGGGWQALGSFDFQPSRSEGVTLTDKADGVVVADAVRFVGPQGAA